MPEPLPSVHEEDCETWEAYARQSCKRWVFNKLEVALRQGLAAGPAGTAPPRTGTYVIRPIYNIFGMGISARKFEYDTSMREAFLNYAEVEPGHFWCEWLDGPHRSIDYRKFDDGKWRCTSMTEGRHRSDDNLVQFDHWVKLDPNDAPKFWQLPIFPSLSDLVAFNVETRSGKVIEIHLRLGNDPFDHLPVGTRITPVWDGETVPDGAEFLGNFYPDLEQYGASGRLPNIRSGYIIERPVT